MTIYFKITNQNETCNGYHYKKGVNIAPSKFSDNPNNMYSVYGFYYTTIDTIYEFYHCGINIWIVDLPKNDPDFVTLRDPFNDKFVANKIIMCEKYSLDDPLTYSKLKIPLPTITDCANNGSIQMAKLMVECGIDICVSDNLPLKCAAHAGYYELVKLFIENGADVLSGDSAALRLAASNGHLPVVSYLVKKGANIHGDNDMAVCRAAENGYLFMVKYLVSKGADIRANNDYTLLWSTLFGHSQVSDFILSLK